TMAATKTRGARNGKPPATTEPTATLPPDQGDAQEGPANGNGPPNGQPAAEKRRPVISFRFPTDRTTTVEVALWPNKIKFADGTEAEVLAATIQRSFKDAQGEYVENRSFRVHDLPVLSHALARAYAYAMDQWELNGSCPF